MCVCSTVLKLQGFIHRNFESVFAMLKLNKSNTNAYQLKLMLFFSFGFVLQFMHYRSPTTIKHANNVYLCAHLHPMHTLAIPFNFNVRSVRCVTPTNHPLTKRVQVKSLTLFTIHSIRIIRAPTKR